MARPITVDELALMRSDVQFSKLYLAILKPNTIYTATLSSVPSSNDQVYQISFGSGSGTLSDVKAGMTLYVGTSAGAYDLGMCRIRKSPIAGTFYIGLTSEIRWNAGGTIYLTVVDEFDLWAKHAVVSSGVMLMDVDVAYSDQHADFNPVPVMGPHAVAWLDGATVDVEFDASDSWVIGSSISGHIWSAPGSSASSGMSTATPTITYDTPGIYRVFDVVTAANGKTTTGVRHVFVYDRDENRPATVFQLAQCMGDNQIGGWMFDMAMEAEAGLSEIRDRTLVVLFAEDWYGPETAKQSIGPVENRENIICVGRIMGESIHWDSEGGYVHFTVQGMQWWLNKIKTFPVELSFVGAASDWAGMPALNMDRALLHILYWHSTAIETMDFYPTNDTRYMPDARTIASTVWGQLNDLAFPKIFAVPGVDRMGRLFIEIDPQMVPENDRDFPEVQEITDVDFTDSIEFARQTVNDVSLISLNAKEVNSAGTSVTRYSLWPGHVPLRYGEPEMLESPLCSSQAQSNQLAGLLGGWRTNPYPDMPVNFAMNNRMIDVFPRQYCSTEVTEPNTPRELAFTLRLIPRRVAMYFDGDTGWMHTEVNFEGETEEGLSTNGDIPDIDATDLELPPLPEISSLPPLPDLPPILPGETSSGSDGGPKKVLIHDLVGGLLLCANFDADENEQTWLPVNAGLTQLEYQIISRTIKCPNGAIYVMGGNRGLGYDYFLKRARYAGATFETIEDQASINAKLGTTGRDGGIGLMSCNPLLPEYVAYTLCDIPANISLKIYHGNYPSFAFGVEVTTGDPRLGDLSYGNGKWSFTGNGLAAKLYRLSGDLSAVEYSVSLDYFTQYKHRRISTTGDIIHFNGDSATISISHDNGATFDNDIGADYVADVGSPIASIFAINPTGQYIMTDMATNGHGKSSDSGATLSAVTFLPATGHNWRFAHCGGNNPSRWVAVSGGGYIYYSNDFFASAPIDKRGNILSLVAILACDDVIVVED